MIGLSQIPYLIHHTGKNYLLHHIDAILFEDLNTKMYLIYLVTRIDIPISKDGIVDQEKTLTVKQKHSGNLLSRML